MFLGLDANVAFGTERLGLVGEYVAEPLKSHTRNMQDTLAKFHEIHNIKLSSTFKPAAECWAKVGRKRMGRNKSQAGFGGVPDDLDVVRHADTGLDGDDSCCELRESDHLPVVTEFVLKVGAITLLGQLKRSSLVQP